jgi:hypothetical protein
MRRMVSADSDLPLGKAWWRQRFVVLLACILLLLAMVPLVRHLGETSAGLARGLLTAAFLVLLLSAAVAVSRSRATAVAAAVLAIPLVLAKVGDTFTDSVPIFMASDVLGLAFLGFISVVILRHLFTVTRVTVNTIAASLCVYLIMGLMWALIYSLVETVKPGSFDLGSVGETGAAMRFGHEHSLYPIYFSLVTMTTLGYGDITPDSDTSRVLSSMEAVIGQIYLAVLVARLVGLQIAHSTAERLDRPARER